MNSLKNKIKELADNTATFILFMICLFVVVCIVGYLFIAGVIAILTFIATLAISYVISFLIGGKFG